MRLYSSCFYDYITGNKILFVLFIIFFVIPLYENWNALLLIIFLLYFVEYVMLLEDLRRKKEKLI